MSDLQTTHLFETNLYDQYTDRLAKEDKYLGKYTVGVNTKGKLVLVKTWLVPIVKFFSFLHTIKFGAKVVAALNNYRGSEKHSTTLASIKSTIRIAQIQNRQAFQKNNYGEELADFLSNPYWANESVTRLLEASDAEAANTIKVEQAQKDHANRTKKSRAKQHARQRARQAQNEIKQSRAKKRIAKQRKAKKAAPLAKKGRGRVEIRAHRRSTTARIQANLNAERIDAQ